MEAIKKNLVSIIFGVVALLAVVAGIAYPLPGMFDDLNAKLKGRKKDYDAIEATMRIRRGTPSVQVDTKDPPELKGYPNQLIINWANKQIAGVKQQGRDMLVQALDIDDRMAWHLPESQKTKPAKPGLLVNDAGYGGGYLLLPNPDDTAKGRFRDRYDEAMRAFYLAPPKAGEKPGTPGTLVSQLKATIPPTPDAFTDEMARIKAAWEARRQLVNNIVVNQKEIDEGIAKEQSEVTDRLKNAQAMGHMLYISPDKGLYYHSKILERVLKGELPNATEIWFAQLGYWIQSDIVKAIVAVNAKSTCVQDSVVKRVVEVYVPDQYLKDTGLAGLGPNPTASAADGRLNPPRGGGAVGGTEAYRYSPTGRVCNPLYDVVQFNFTVYVDERRMGSFLTEISRDRLINVIEMNVRGIDRAAEQALGYMYGEAPVVELRLKCEALFLRAWTTPLMPLEIKQLVGIQTTN